MELAPCQTGDFIHGLSDGPCWLIGSVMSQGVEYVGHTDHLGANRDSISLQSCRITAAVPVLVVIEGDLFRDLQNLGSAVSQNSATDGGVCLHESPFLSV